MASSSIQNDEIEDWQASKRTTRDRLEFLLNNVIMSDVTFCFGDGKKNKKNLYAHSWIMSFGSSVFYKIFRGNFEVCKQIPVTDVSEEVFLEFLRYLYVDICHLTEKNVIPVLSLAKKYQIPYLENDCSKFIETELTEDTVCEILESIIQFKYGNLQIICLNFIGGCRFQSILESKSFLTINNDTLKAILGINDIGLSSEFNLFIATIEWAAAECTRQKMKINGINKRVVLGELIKLIRFPAMAIEEFVKCVTEEGLLTPNEIASIILTFSTNKNNEFGFKNEKRESVEKLPLCKLDIVKTNCSGGYAMATEIAEFTINRPVFIFGVDIMYYKPQNYNYHTNYVVGKNSNITLQLINDKKEILSEINENENTAKFEFRKPIFLEQNRMYNLTFTCPINSIYKNSNPHPFQMPYVSTLNNVSITFSKLTTLLSIVEFKTYP